MTDQPGLDPATRRQQRLVLILAVVGAVVAAGLAAAAVVVWANTCGPPAPMGPQPSAGGELSPVWATTPCGSRP